jgi:putative alpha-1,2-mannosidase
MARIRYPASTAAQLLLHAGRSATGSRAGAVEIVGPDRIVGSATAGGFCGSSKTFTIYFAAQFDAPFTAHGTWAGAVLTKDASSASGTPAGAYLTFDTTQHPVVQMKIALSYVSLDNARANLDAENAGWDFDAVRAAAAARWNQVLERIEIQGGSDDDARKFYTALYHVFQSPNVASDVDGKYMGFDGAVHTADGWTVYQNYSGWDIIRSWTHLVSAIAPEAPDIIRSMVEDGVQSGLLPFWTQQNVETNVMVGDPGTVNVANAYAMGVRGFDTAAALGLMVKSATNPGDTQRFDLQDWLDFHYVGDASITLEYAMADFAISQFAGALGETATRDEFLARSDWWKQAWNPADGYVEPRVATPGGDAARIYEVQVFGPAAPMVDLALNRPTTASGQCNANESPAKAANGTWTGGNADKWCDNASPQKWWQVDLGAVNTLDSVVIFHAGAGNEDTSWNTLDFALKVSTDGTTWETVADVTGNTDSVSVHPITAFAARYVRLEIVHATQTGTTGAWMCRPFDPARDSCGYVEGNAAQYVWMVPHDLEGLFTLMGGHDTAIRRLDDLFTALNAGTGNPYFYIGNEPEHGTPWTYNFAGAPWKTQRTVRRIIDEAYTTAAGGLPGNDDLGATSAWLVWAYLGLYPVIPGTDVLVLHGPQFPSITMHLATGHALAIRGAGAGAPGAHFVQSLSVDGAPTTRSWLRYGDLAGGATLQFTMGAAPNQTWGSAAGDVPPSFAP